MSAVISADAQRLSATGFTPIWTSASDFTVACWVKVTTAQWGDIFSIADNGDESYSHVAMRASSTPHFDHSVCTQSAATRLDFGSVGSTWQLIGITSEAGVACVSFVNGASVGTDSGAKNAWANGQGFDSVCIGYFSALATVGQHSGRFKIAHCSVWNKKLTAGEWADLYNGGAGGYGKNPQAVAAANLKYYSALTSDATVEVGGVTLTNTGGVTFDGADNPTVEAFGGGGVDGTAPGATLTGTSSLTAGGASGTAAGTAPGATLTGTSTLTAGSATGNATGSFTTAAMENNSGAGLLASTAVVWTWYEGAIGGAPTSTVHGTGTTNLSGILTATGLPIAAGFLLVRTTDGSGVYYQSGTPA